MALALAILAVMWSLNHFGGSAPAIAQCTATASAVGSHRLTPDQADNAALIAAISQQRELPARAATIGIATAMQESKLRNIDYGDRDSLGLFQQRPSQGWGTAEQVQNARYATEAFFDVLARIKDYEDLPVTVAAQHVQRSAFPDAYAQHEDMARAFASALTGHSPAGIDCELPATETRDMAGFLARFAADFPQLDASESEKQVIINFSQDSDTDPPAIQLWAVANWAVAVSHAYGIENVAVAGQQWTRTTAWHEQETKTLDQAMVIIGFE